jgi:DNA-binding transcriptional LysR family regulator
VIAASRADRCTQQVHAACAGISWSATTLDPRLELRHLRYFVTVAETLHFGRAAKALHISQPPLSRQVRDLESYVGATLLLRSPKAVQLTEAGAIFLEEARRILSGISISVRMAQRASEGEMSRLAIAFEPHFDSEFLAGIRESFAADHPDVRLTFHRVHSEEQAALIRGGSLDAGLLTLPVAESDQLCFEPLFREPAIAVVSASHPLAARVEVNLKELARYPVLEICDDPGVPSYGHAGRIGTMCGVHLSVDRCSPTIEKLPRMLRDLNAFALLPAGVRDLYGEGIRCVRIKDAGADFTFGLVYDRSRISSVLARLISLARRMNETQSRAKATGIAAA